VPLVAPPSATAGEEALVNVAAVGERDERRGLAVHAIELCITDTEARRWATVWGGQRREGVGRKGGQRKKINMVGPMFGGGNGGPPRMEAERGDLEGYAK
jgi:hypothetical protein